MNVICFELKSLDVCLSRVKEAVEFIVHTIIFNRAVVGIPCVPKLMLTPQLEVPYYSCLFLDNKDVLISLNDKISSDVTTVVQTIQDNATNKIRSGDMPGLIVEYPRLYLYIICPESNKPFEKWVIPLRVTVPTEDGSVKETGRWRAPYTPGEIGKGLLNSAQRVFNFASKLGVSDAVNRRTPSHLQTPIGSRPVDSIVSRPVDTSIAANDKEYLLLEKEDIHTQGNTQSFQSEDHCRLRSEAASLRELRQSILQQSVSKPAQNTRRKPMYELTTSECQWSFFESLQAIPHHTHFNWRG
eukprot:GHVR01049684.1.p1 GENE.GHVR01049684.1~~GHVR01049684.1.p1  ORF type:complete len:299 (+),score=64.03 GHVR01049684.1:22-918(+)